MEINCQKEFNCPFYAFGSIPTKVKGHTLICEQSCAKHGKPCCCFTCNISNCIVLSSYVNTFTTNYKFKFLLKLIKILKNEKSNTVC